MSNQIWKSLSLSSLIIVVLSFMATAQDRSRVFSIPDARSGEQYSVSIEEVLREKYTLKLESGSPNAVIQWYLAAGELPVGIALQTNGTITGTPTRANDYRFRLRVIDASVKDEELLIDFALSVKVGHLRLSRIEGPRLVPVRVDVNDSTDSIKPLTDSSRVGESRSAVAKTPAAIINAEDQEQSNLEGDNPEDKKADEKAVSSPLSSLNKRFILGFEQTAAASADATGRPFFDLFINTPLSGRKSCDEKRTASAAQSTCLPARFSIWGDVRLTSNPEQVNALSGVASNGVGTITDGKLNQIGSAFDFVIGPEVRIKRFYGTDISLIGAFGAVSPLSPKQSAQIFEVPDAASSQADAFFKKYPGAQGKQFIAFVSPDRDRFLRQYFAGFRFKTFKYEDDQLQNIFPAMLDVTFGQNEAVTGGRLHKFVVGIDGFYPLPFPDKSRFLYLFGSARFKAGGPKTFDTPFILDTAASSVKITDPKVFIADPITTNRDTYRIGFGVDLIELFKFAKDQGNKEGQETAARKNKSSNPKPGP